MVTLSCSSNLHCTLFATSFVGVVNVAVDLDPNEAITYLHVLLINSQRSKSEQIE